MVRELDLYYQPVQHDPKPMTKAAFLRRVAELYAVGNLSDASDNPMRPDWVNHKLSRTVCSRLDRMLAAMADDGALTDEDIERFYSDDFGCL